MLYVYVEGVDSVVGVTHCGSFALLSAFHNHIDRAYVDVYTYLSLAAACRQPSASFEPEARQILRHKYQVTLLALKGLRQHWNGGQTGAFHYWQGLACQADGR
jgi:hypothetical protein